MRRLTILGIFFGLLISGFVFAESQEPPPHPKHRAESNKNAQDHNSPAQNTIATNKEPVPSHENPSPETGNEKNQDWLMIFTGILAVSTIGLWVAAIYQTRISRQSLTTSERACVGVGFERPYVLGHACVDLRIFNCGKSIGHIKDIQLFGFEVVNKGTPIPDNPKSVQPHGKGVWSIFPGESTPQRWDVQFKPEDIDEIATKNKLLPIHGYIRYVDIFGNEHTTKFYRVWMEDKGPLDGIFAIPPDATPEQNEAT